LSGTLLRLPQCTTGGGERSFGALVHRSFFNGLEVELLDRNQSDPSHAVQTSCRPPPSHWQDEAQSDKLEYEADLRRRGSLTLWVTPEALAGWHAPRRRIRGGQRRYSDLAIETTLTLACVFSLPLRQTEGFIRSILDLLGLQLPVPDHTTLSRRAQRWERRAGRLPSMPDGPIHVLIDSTGLKIYGAGQWLDDRHGTRSRRSWRKLHLAVNAGNQLRPLTISAALMHQRHTGRLLSRNFALWRELQVVRIVSCRRNGELLGQ
jgi:hypothetical protein